MSDSCEDFNRPGQISNRNYLSPIGFRFILNRFPKVTYFCNAANIPGITLGIANQPTYLKDIDTPGDKIVFDDLNIRFLVDEDLNNYIEIFNWIRGLGYPETLDEIYDLQKEAKPAGYRTGMNIYSDGTLQVLNSSMNANFNVNFKDLWPYSLTTLQFDATNPDQQYFTAEVGFKYTIFNITDLRNKKL